MRVWEEEITQFCPRLAQAADPLQLRRALSQLRIDKHLSIADGTIYNIQSFALGLARDPDEEIPHFLVPRAVYPEHQAGSARSGRCASSHPSSKVA